MRPEEYNARTMERFGWGREHLDLPPEASMEEVVDAVVAFQASQGLEVDGKVGPDTWRRLQTHSEHLIHDKYPDAEGFIRCDDVLRPTPFKSIPCSPGSAFSLIGEGGHSNRKSNPTQVVWHWDAALSAGSCYKILKKRGLSCHGGIDNDGTFLQFLDFTSHVGWHAGQRRVNKTSLGFEISNAVYMKYQGYYEKRWGKRPVVTAKVHGATPTFLGFYESQIETCIGLAKFINEEYGISLEYPEETTTIKAPWEFNGHLAHYHISRKKWDVAGFPFERLMREAGGNNV